MDLAVVKGRSDAADGEVAVTKLRLYERKKPSSVSAAKSKRAILRKVVSQTWGRGSWRRPAARLAWMLNVPPFRG